MTLIDRKSAKAQGYKFYYTGFPCVNNHIDYRITSNGRCYTCSKIAKEKWRKDNIDHTKVYHKKYSKEHYSNNRTKYYSSNAKRRASKLHATPAWLSRPQLIYMHAFYALCPENHHVDHIVPLQGKTVCGLHVPWNLQILTASENLKKGNSLHECW